MDRTGREEEVEEVGLGAAKEERGGASVAGEEEEEEDLGQDGERVDLGSE